MKDPRSTITTDLFRFYNRKTIMKKYEPTIVTDKFRKQYYNDKRPAMRDTYVHLNHSKLMIWRVPNSTIWRFILDEQIGVIFNYDMKLLIPMVVDLLVEESPCY